MLICAGMKWNVAERISTGMRCGLTDERLVPATAEHALVGYAAEDFEPNDYVQLDFGGMIRKTARGGNL